MPKNLGGLTDDQIANAYGASGLYALGDTGAGVSTSASTSRSRLRSDVRRFDNCYFGASAAANDGRTPRT